MTLMEALFNPATSPWLSSSSSLLKPLRSQYLRYMRSSICVQSWASVPPWPALMSMKQLLGSSGSLNMRRNSRSATSFSVPWTSAATERSVSSSPSALASVKSSAESFRPASIFSTVVTTSSRARRSCPGPGRALRRTRCRDPRACGRLLRGATSCCRSRRYLRSSRARGEVLEEFWMRLIWSDSMAGLYGFIRSARE